MSKYFSLLICFLFLSGLTLTNAGTPDNQSSKFNNVSISAIERDNIKVTFTNGTDLKVYFYLNGGTGLNTSIAAGDTQTYNMVVDKGVTPEVRIKQPSGDYLPFSVSHEGEYIFKVDRGQIKNYYK